MDSKIFFKPRYDKEKYEKGYKGYRTLILGVFHVCRTECKFREDCFKNTAKYDRECPVYKGREEYYSLSNSNEIEVESYLEECDSHYSYSYITKYFLRTNESVSENDKRKFWDSIAFTNFLQNMHGSYDTLKYRGNKKKFKDNLAAFKELLELLKPEVIYVISRAVKDCLCAKGNEINGLEFVDSYENWQVPVFRFTYNIKSKGRPEEILKSVEEEIVQKKVKVKGNIYKFLLKKIDEIKGLKFSVQEESDDLKELLQLYVWDKDFNEFLRIKDFEISLKFALKQAFNSKYDINKDIYELIRIIQKHKPTYSLQYMNVGWMVDFYNKLNSYLIKEKIKMDEFYFMKTIGIKDKDTGLLDIKKNKWRFIKKEYSDIKELVIHSKTAQDINSNNTQEKIETVVSNDIKTRLSEIKMVLKITE